DFFKSCRPVINHLVSSQKARETGITGRDRSDDVRAAPMRQLHRETTDAARRAVNQNPLAALQFSFFKKPLPRGQRRNRNDGGLDMDERFWFARQPGRLDDAEFRLRAVAEPVVESEDLVAGAETVDLRADRFDDAGKLVAQHDG